MRFSSIALTSAAFACTALAVPAPAPTPAPHPPTKVWHGKGYGGWGKNKGHEYGNPSPAPAPTSTPAPGNGTCPDGPSACIVDQAVAEAASNIYKNLISNYTDELAIEALTEDFVDWSATVNIIRNKANEGPFVVNEVTFDNRAEFVAAQGSQPLIPFDILNIWHGCDTVTTRWQTLDSARGQPTWTNDIPVVGLGLMKIEPASDNSYGFRISELYSEFTSAAWLVNNGAITPEPVTTSNFPEAGATQAPAKRDFVGI